MSADPHAIIKLTVFIAHQNKLKRREVESVLKNDITLNLLDLLVIRLEKGFSDAHYVCKQSFYIY